MGDGEKDSIARVFNGSRSGFPPLLAKFPFLFPFDDVRKKTEAKRTGNFQFAEN